MCLFNDTRLSSGPAQTGSLLQAPVADTTMTGLLRDASPESNSASDVNERAQYRICSALLDLQSKICVQQDRTNDCILASHDTHTV